MDSTVQKDRFQGGGGDQTKRASLGELEESMSG